MIYAQREWFAISSDQLARKFAHGVALAGRARAAGRPRAPPRAKGSGRGRGRRGTHSRRVTAVVTQKARDRARAHGLSFHFVTGTQYYACVLCTVAAPRSSSRTKLGIERAAMISLFIFHGYAILCICASRFFRRSPDWQVCAFSRESYFLQSS